MRELYEQTQPGQSFTKELAGVAAKVFLPDVDFIRKINRSEKFLFPLSNLTEQLMGTAIVVEGVVLGAEGLLAASAFNLLPAPENPLHVAVAGLGFYGIGKLFGYAGRAMFTFFDTPKNNANNK